MALAPLPLATAQGFAPTRVLDDVAALGTVGPGPSATALADAVSVIPT